MFADEIRRAIEAASRITLPQVTALLWRAYGDGKVTEAEAESLSGLIEARSLTNDGLRPRRTANPRGTADTPVAVASQKLVSPFRRAVGSRPRTDGSLERRRRWAASGRLPPGLAARFTLAEQAVLALVAAEVVRRKDCRLAVGQLAALVGVAETTVRNAIREAVKLGLVTVEERRVTGFRNDTNIVRIVSPEWIAWLRLARRAPTPGGPPSRAAEPTAGGCKSVQGTPTEVPDSGKPGTTAPSQCCREAAGDLDRSALPRIRADGRTG
ncbi:helix-turn-helix domain-containing protein [Methylobacterium sp. 092160098-2]|uniref:helix-turn-helix domain-containing protein n=1 Tax=Methylobacterium sp. 092160098-2 TaxID=3025129 RepID=UPI002381B3BD|nr:helix-turn-helix domain-containing protein [Methylobacterium sp. 092160098-2]MDE4916103.1 helix-turn-helix domain-containing protein [Methylobacterium sp. 092160098-2]